MNSSNEFDAYFETLFESDEKGQSTAEPSHNREATRQASTPHQVRQKPATTHMVRAQTVAQESIPALETSLTSGWEKVKVGYPISFARSALFSVSESGDGDVKDLAIETSVGIKMKYSGPRLNQEHARVWSALCQVCQGVSGSIIVSHGEILELLGLKGIDFRSHQRLWSLINDMSDSQITLETTRVRYKGVLIHTVAEDKLTGKVYIGVNHGLASLFENELICEAPEIKAAIGNGQLSLWLHSYISSHKYVYPIAVSELRRICGSRRPLKKFRYELKKAAEVLQSGENPLITSWSIDKATDRFSCEKRKTTVKILNAEMLGANKQTKPTETYGSVSNAVQRAREQRGKVAL